MGVNIFLLEKRTIKLAVGGMEQDIGSLRRFWKVTELTADKADEIEAAERRAANSASPAAAMLADVCEMPIGITNGAVKAHIVLGWDEGRSRVTDLRWDYLPVIGYGVKTPGSASFVLHGQRDGTLFPLSRERAATLGLVGSDGLLRRHGQPLIKECRSVRYYMPGWAEADCVFNDGTAEKLLIGVEDDRLPEPAWLVAKKPMQVEHYRPAAK